jgi:hypothetical protein
MRNSRFRLPSPAIVISMVALSLVLGGTAIAATATDGDAKADTTLIKQLAPTLSVKHATSAASAEPIAFAHVSSSGVVDSDNSKNVTAVTLVGNSVYCLNGIASAVTVRGGQATVDFNGAGSEFAQFGLGDKSGDCPAGTKAFVWTVDGTTASKAAFFVVLYG